jgi:hypothetical protein
MNKMISSNFQIFIFISCLLSYSVLGLQLHRNNLRENKHTASYKDNLLTQNWYYGNISSIDYRLKIFQAATQYDVSACPLSSPFANADMSQC